MVVQYQNQIGFTKQKSIFQLKVVFYYINNNSFKTILNSSVFSISLCQILNRLKFTNCLRGCSVKCQVAVGLLTYSMFFFNTYIINKNYLLRNILQFCSSLGLFEGRVFVIICNIQYLTLEIGLFNCKLQIYTLYFYTFLTLIMTSLFFLNNRSLFLEFLYI